MKILNSAKRTKFPLPLSGGGQDGGRFDWIPAFAGITVAVLALAACTPTKAVRGNLVDDYRLEQVKPGMSTASDVVGILGSPTSTDPFDPNIWYYIGQKTEKKGILDPKVTDERILRLTFNPDTRVLSDITPLETRRNDIPIKREVTPTAGNELNALQQMLGNMGKFNKTGGGSSPTDIGR
jgi:outer membrane protein assembly factor BamE (lipoprotein component of BamABCDE complex)